MSSSFKSKTNINASKQFRKEQSVVSEFLLSEEETVL